jgi:hypothetical protein
LNDTLQAVARQGAGRAEDGDQCETQSCSNPWPSGAHQRITGRPLNKKLLEPPGCQESSGPVRNGGPVMANSIAIRDFGLVYQVRGPLT